MATTVVVMSKDSKEIEAVLDKLYAAGFNDLHQEAEFDYDHDDHDCAIANFIAVLTHG